MTLRLTNCLAANFDGPLRALAARWGARFDDTLPWQAREQLVDDGRVEVAWTCGLLFALKDRARAGVWEPFAAPVMAAAHYRDRPVYFTEVVVRAGSGYERLEHLRGARFVYNDRQSLSGCHALRDLRAQQRGLEPVHTIVSGGVMSGGHLRSLAYLRAGDADFALIDSTVLEAWRRTEGSETQQETQHEVRSLARLGPYPSPPLLVRADVAPEVRSALRREVLSAHERCGVALRAAGIARFVAAEARDYDRLRAYVPDGAG
ncbi:MAG: PhnD/SsuA/transferrin family substrate-binding protein [Trueperaceae bacterium]|nr:PhnD/SsuA/transferrin family substrate-binding protein [Trueperaceae bacterium]